MVAIRLGGLLISWFSLHNCKWLKLGVYEPHGWSCAWNLENLLLLKVEILIFLTSASLLQWDCYTCIWELHYRLCRAVLHPTVPALLGYARVRKARANVIRLFAKKISSTWQLPSYFSFVGCNKYRGKCGCLGFLCAARWKVVGRWFSIQPRKHWKFHMYYKILLQHDLFIPLLCFIFFITW